MRFRKMKIDDLPEVSELGIGSKATWGYSEEAMAIFTEELTHGSELITQSLEAILAIAEEKLVGYFTLIQIDEATIELDFMFVAPEALRQGIGTAMMKEAVLLAQSHGAAHLRLIADPNAVGFYEKFGAKKVSDHQSRIPGRTIPVMEIELSSG